MKRDLKRISDELILPQEIRDRIRSQLASYQKQSEDIPMKKATLKSRVPLIAAAVAVVMVLTLTAGAVVVHLFRNDIILSSTEKIRESSSENMISITAPGGNAPITLDEMTEGFLFLFPAQHRWKYSHHRLDTCGYKDTLCRSIHGSQSERKSPDGD